MLEEKAVQRLLLGTKAEPCRSASRAEPEAVEQAQTKARWGYFKRSVTVGKRNTRSHAAIVMMGRGGTVTTACVSE